MEKIEEFVDERQKSWCIHCNGWIEDLTTNYDHVPSRCLLEKPHPKKLPEVRVCKACNKGFATDEEYLAAFLGAVISGSTDPNLQRSAKAKGILNWNTGLRASIEQAKTEYQTHGGETRLIWKPEPAKVNRVVIKNARGHAYFEIGEPMLSEPARVWTAPLELLTAEERARFEAVDLGAGWPEVGSRMMTRLITGQDMAGPWVIVQEGIYRYAVAQNGSVLVRSVLSEYLATEVRWD